MLLLAWSSRCPSSTTLQRNAVAETLESSGFNVAFCLLAGEIIFIWLKVLLPCSSYSCELLTCLPPVTHRTSRWRLVRDALWREPGFATCVITCQIQYGTVRMYQTALWKGSKHHMRNMVIRSTSLLLNSRYNFFFFFDDTFFKNGGYILTRVQCHSLYFFPPLFTGLHWNRQHCRGNRLVRA